MKKSVILGMIRHLFLGLAIMSFMCIAFGDESRYRIGREDSIMQEKSYVLIDDFSDQEGVSSLGMKWTMFTDRVMGGLSIAESFYEVIDGRRCLRLQGSISLANNGGFAQVALPLDLNGRFFDASGFKGIRLWVQGNGEDYYVHLRTNQTRRPWQFYGADFKASQNWERVEIPFEKFEPEGLDKNLNTGELTRIAIVAIKKEFKADVAVSRLEFYR